MKDGKAHGRRPGSLDELDLELPRWLRDQPLSRIEAIARHIAAELAERNVPAAREGFQCARAIEDYLRAARDPSLPTAAGAPAPPRAEP